MLWAVIWQWWKKININFLHEHLGENILSHSFVKHRVTLYPVTTDATARVWCERAASETTDFKFEVQLNLKGAELDLIWINKTITRPILSRFWTRTTQPFTLLGTPILETTSWIVFKTSFGSCFVNRDTFETAFIFLGSKFHMLKSAKGGKSPESLFFFLFGVRRSRTWSIPFSNEPKIPRPFLDGVSGSAPILIWSRLQS